MLKIYIIIIIFTLSNCASETAKMAHQIKNDKNNVFVAKNSTECMNIRDNSVEKEDKIFLRSQETVIHYFSKSLRNSQCSLPC